MSGVDDKLDEKTSSAWREASREQPPPAIDAALRAAARRAVAAGPARSRHMQSWPLLAAAIVAFLAIGILQLAPPEEVTPGVERDTALRPAPQRQVEPVSPAAPAAPTLGTPAPAATAPAAPLDSTQSLARSATADADRRSELTASATQRERASERKKVQAPEPASAVDALKERQTRANADTAQAQSRADAAKLDAGDSKVLVTPSATPAPSPSPAPEAFPAAPPVAGSAPLAAGNAQATLPAQRGALAPSSAPPAAAANAPAKPERAAEQAPAPMALAKSAASGAKDAPKPPDEWIKLIRRLRSEGHNEDAMRELTAFRAAYKERADELLPADLRSLR